jgi:biotin transport system substrate-specific component
MTSYAYADLFRPAVAKRALIYDAVLALTGSLIIALASQLAVYLPFSPVPVTGQTLAVLMLGAVLGSRRGLISVLAYLAEGAMGLPVFAGGAAGIARILGPTGGYLLGFALAAFVTGWLAERGWDRQIIFTLLAMILGNIVIYVVGLGWLSIYVGMKNAVPMGLYPFIAGDLLKIALATLALPSSWKLLGIVRKLRAYTP